MASPYVFEYTVKDSDGPIRYADVCYEVGDVIKLKHSDKHCFYELLMPEPEKSCCFPEYCLTADGYPTDGYRVPVLVPAGSTVVHSVPSIEGCKPAGQVHFHYCANCLYVGYDSAPLVDPEDPNAADGGGADPNPTVRDLIHNGVQVQTIHILNPTDADVLVMLSYYC